MIRYRFRPLYPLRKDRRYPLGGLQSQSECEGKETKDPIMIRTLVIQFAGVCFNLEEIINCSVSLLPCPLSLYIYILFYLLLSFSSFFYFFTSAFLSLILLSLSRTFFSLSVFSPLSCSSFLSLHFLLLCLLSHVFFLYFPTSSFYLYLFTSLFPS